MKHRQNLKEVFAATPSVRVKVDAVTTHSTSTLHSSALESELLQRMSYFHKETTKKSAVQNTTLEQVFATAYFLMKSFIANRQFIPMLTFVEKVFDVESVKYFQHRSAGAQTEIFLTMGNTMKKEVLRKVKSALAFGILTDEVADVSVTENLVTFIQFYCRETDQVETQFLSCQNVLENFQSANAEAIATLLLKEIEELDDLDLGCFTGLTSDGASVMVGKRSGVAARLKQVNPTLINVHCICHRLALACTDSNESLSNIKDVETWLRQLWQFFENSPKRMAAYLKIQTQLKSIRLEGKGVKRVIKRLKKACRTRWLSLEASVKAVHEDYEAVLQTLAQFEQKDATASGLFRKMKSLKFLGVIYIMREVLPVLGDLSRRFQKGSLNFAAILPAINMTKDRLQNLSEDETPLNNLRNDIDSFTDMCADIKMNKNDGQQLQSVFSKYVVALVSNIDNRFSDSSEVLTAFNIFNPTAVPDSAAEMRTYGNQQIDILSNHYFSENQDRSDKLKAQWHAMKYHIRDAIKPNLPESVKSGSDISPTEWLLLQLLKDTSVRQLYPDIVYIAEVVASLPVSNAWPERGASALKSVKTRLRNRLSSSMLESILHICINAPEPSSAAGQKLVEKAVKSWLENKSRRKLPKIASAPGLSYNNTSHEPVVMMEETGVQTEPMDQGVPEREEWIKKAVDLAIKKLNLDQYGSDDEDDDDWSDDDACCS